MQTNNCWFYLEINAEFDSKEISVQRKDYAVVSYGECTILNNTEEVIENKKRVEIKNFLKKNMYRVDCKGCQDNCSLPLSFDDIFD